MSIFQDKFTTGQVIAATGVTNHTLQSWMKRNMLTGNPVEPIGGGGASGSHRKFSIFTVVEIAVAKALIDIGLSTANALHAAKSFAHTGDGPLGPNPERCPSLPFDDRGEPGLTLLCVAGESSMEVLYHPKRDVLANVRYRLGPAFVVLEINDLFDRVCDTLGYHPNDVMADAYPRKNPAE